MPGDPIYAPDPAPVPSSGVNGPDLGGGNTPAPAPIPAPAPLPDPAPAPPAPAVEPDANPYVAIGRDMAQRKAAEPNPYVEAGKAYGAARRAALQASLSAATETDADRQARVLALSSKLQMPSDIVDRNLDLLSNRAKLTGIDAGRLLNEHPELAGWLSKPENAAVAQDDLPVLQTIDHAMRALTHPEADPTGILPTGFLFDRSGQIVEPDGKGFSTFVGGIDDLRRLLDTRDDRAAVEQIDRLTRIDQLQRMYAQEGMVTQVGSGVLGSATGSLVLNALRLAGAQGQSEDDALQAFHAAAAGQIQTRLGGYLDPGALLRGGIGLVEDAPLLLAGGQLGRLVGGTTRLAKTARVATTFAPVNLASFVEDTRTHGLKYGAASLLINSLIPAAFGETGAARVLLGKDAATAAAGGWGAAAVRFLGDVGIQATQMQALEAAHALHEFASGVDPQALRMDRLIPRLITAGLLGGTQAGFLHLPVAIGEKLHRDVVAAGAADSYAHRLSTAIAVVRASKLQERSPESMAVLLRGMVGENGKTYLQAVDWDAHWKKQGQDPLEAAKAVGAEQAYREAKATGGDMAVPVEAFIQGAAMLEGADALVAKARQEPGAMSSEEASAFHKALPDNIEKLRAEVQAAAEQAHDEPTQAVHDDLSKQLIDAGTEPATAKRQARIIASGFRVLADRMNAGAPEGARLTAKNLYDRYQLKIQRADNGVPADGSKVLDQRVPAAEGQKLNDPEALRARAEAAARGELDQPVDPNAATGRYPAIQSGEAMGQPGSDGRRGQITFGPDGRATVSLFEQKNLSTFLHEGGHLFLEVFGDLAGHENAPPQIREDYAKILEWLGVKDRASIATEHHERFARGFETYLMEGKAPSPELRSTFARVKEWFKGLYRNLAALNADLSDGVRGVFDRLLATDDEIAAAERTAGVRQLFTTAADAGMTDRQFEAYRATAEKAHATAVSDLERQLIAEERQAQTEAYKARRGEVRAAVEAEVDKNPVFLALNALQDGKLPGGEPMAEAVKLDRADLVERYGEEGLKKLPGPGKGRTNRGRHVYAVDGGLTLDQAAELFGFATGDDLYRALVDAPNREKEIDHQTSEQMQALYPDSRTDGSFVEKAQAAVENDHRSDVLVAELKALRKLQREAKPVATEAAKTATEAERQRGDNRVADAVANANAELAYEKALGRAKVDTLKADQRAADQADTAARQAAAASIPPVELLRATAREAVAAQRVGDLNPNGYLVAARKASREAFAANGRGDYAKAADAKQQELMAHELYRAASDRKVETEAGLKHLRGLQTAKARERIGKAGGWEWTVTKPDGSVEVFANEAEAEKAATNTPGSAFARTSGYLEQMDALLDRFDLRTVSDAALRRRETLAQWLAQRSAADEQVAIPEHLIDETLRKNWKQLTVDDFAGLVDAAKNIETMARLKNKLLRDREQRTLDERAAQVSQAIEGNSRGARPRKVGRSILDRPAEWFGLMLSSLRKMTSLVREMDGFKDGGVIHDLTIRSLNEASDAESVDRHASAVAFHDLAKEWGKLGPSAALRRRIPGFDRPISTEARIAVALNWGNAGNRRRLLKGNGFSEGDVHAILDSLDEKDWRFVQGILDHVNSYWPRIAAKQQRVTGVAPEKVDALPIETRFGTFKGGYYPVAYDPRLSAKSHGMLVEEQANLMKAGGYTAATTRRGHTKARAEEGSGAPLRLDLGVIPEHLARVIHDLSFHETLIDVNRLMRRKEVEESLRAHYGDRAYDLVQATLQDTAAGQVFAQDGFEKAVNWLTAGSGAATMGWNLQVALMNASGITQSLARIGPAYLLKGLGHVLRDAAGWQNSGTWIDSVSPYMRERSRIMLRDAEDVTRRMNATGALDPLRHSFHYFTVKMDRAVGIPTWLGAYEKAMAEHGDEPKAIAAADATVRETQGSNAVHDLAAVQRGHPMKRLFTQFYHYMSTTWNLTAESANRFRGSVEAPISLQAIGHDAVAGARLASDVLCLYLLPAAMAAAIRTWLHPHKDQRKGFADEYPREVAGMFLGTIPLVRDFASVITAGTAYKGPTGTRGLEQIGDLVARLRGEFDKPQKDHHLDRALLQTLGLILRLPTVQVARTIDGFVYLSEHGGSPAALIGGRPPKR